MISILVVSDQVDIRDHYRKMLRLKGFAVSLCFVPEEVVYMATKLKPFVTLIDLESSFLNCTNLEILCFQLKSVTQQILCLWDSSLPVPPEIIGTNLSILFKPIDDSVLLLSIYESVLPKIMIAIREYEQRIAKFVNLADEVRQVMPDLSQSTGHQTHYSFNPDNSYYGGSGTEPIATNHLANQAGKSATAKLPELTKRQREILLLIASGYTNREIGEKLFLSSRTVEAHRRRLMQKLDVRGVSNLIRLAVEFGLVPRVFKR